MNPSQVFDDLPQWQSLFDWLEEPSMRVDASDAIDVRNARNTGDMPADAAVQLRSR